MAVSRFKGFVGILVAGSMMASSTAAVAATSTVPITQVNPWATLTAMSGGAPAAALCGAAAVAAAAQPAPGCVLPQVDNIAPPAPVPVPPVEAAAGKAVSPLLLALGAIAAAVLLYFLLRGHHHHDNEPNSPA